MFHCTSVNRKQGVGMKKLIMMLLVLMAAGCGGGGGGSDTPFIPSPAGTVFNLGKYASLSTGSSYTITFTGSDTTGATYTGSQQSNIVGATIFEGQSVTQRDVALTLNKSGVGVLLATTAHAYYKADKTLYKTVYSNGVVATPTSTFPVPSSVQIGNFAGQSLSYSNGSSLSSTWQVTDAGSSTANIVVSTTTNQGLSEVDTLTVAASGTMLSIRQILYNFPSAGVTTTLNGTMN